MQEVRRGMLHAFWKAHILHPAAEQAPQGQWMLNELRHYGHEIGPGTLYPLPQRVERLG